MLSQFVTVLQGTLSPALLVMVLGTLTVRMPDGTEGSARRGLSGARWRMAGLCVGLLAAIVFAVLRATAVITRRSGVNLPALSVAVVVDAVLLIVLLSATTSGRLRRLRGRSSRPRRGEGAGPGITPDPPEPSAPRPMVLRRLAATLADAVAALAIASAVFVALPDVILPLTVFVEPGETPFTSAMLLRALGFLLGLASVVVAAAVLRTLHSPASRTAFGISGVAVVTLVLVRHATALLQLLQGGTLMLHGRAFLALVWFINHDRALVMVQAWVFVIPVVASLVAGIRGTAPAGAEPWRADPASAPNAADIRRRRAFRRRSIAAAAWSLVMVIGVTTALTVGVAALDDTPELSKPEAYSLKDGRATVTFAQVSDGHLHRFQYRAKDGTVMRFIVILKNGNAYGVGLDACENCGDAGYYEKDGKIICRRCNVAINLAPIGFKGGCNPILVSYTSTAKGIVIATADLDALSSHFR